MSWGHPAEPWRLLANLAGLVAVVGLFWGPIQATIKKPAGPPATPGFQARMESTPAGAEIWIQGRARGNTPWIGNVACRNGEQVLFEVKAEGFTTWRRRPACREGGSLEIHARLLPTQPAEATESTEPSENQSP